MTKETILKLKPETLIFDVYNDKYFYDKNTKKTQYDYFYVDIITDEIPELEGERKVATVMVQCNDKDDLLYNDQYIIDVVTYDLATQEINGQVDQSRYDRQMNVVDGLELPKMDDITVNGDTLDEYIIRMLKVVFMAFSNKNMYNPEKYELKVGYDRKEPVQIRHRGCFAWDGCHKIYLCQNMGDIQQMLAYGYDIYPIEQLRTVWKNSCPLRFIHPVDFKNDDILPQFAKYPKIIGHRIK